MLTEYHGQPVAGGTYPALIWKAFMAKALAYRQADADRRSRRRRSRTRRPRRVIFRDGRLELDNGHCRGTTTMQFFTGQAPTTTADCKPNEVEVPNVRRRDARRRPGAPARRSRCCPTVVYKPARPGQRARRRGRADPAQRDALGLRQGEARRARGRCTASCRGSSGCPSQGARARLAQLKLARRVIAGGAARAGRRAGAAAGRRGRPGHARRAHREALETGG